MRNEETVLKNDERISLRLRSLYRDHGYMQYKMSKFEEYDLYASNKDFLISDHVITFTDTNGKLMALKPDVTLSIIKNSKDGARGVQKVYYSENVYRVSGSTRAFKEIMQTGLECIGEIDDYAISEVLMLAAESLSRISPDYVLDISHLDIVSALLDECGFTSEVRAAVLAAVGEKNRHAIVALAEGAGACREKVEPLLQLVALRGSAAEVLSSLPEIVKAPAAKESVERLTRIVSALSAAGYGERVRIDFSVINDMNYYNGIVFKGFVNGVPAGVLSGGQYDRLMSKMGKRASAIGFAVYLDLLERLCERTAEFDVDTVLLYDKGADLAAVSAAVRGLLSACESVTAQRVLPEKLKYRRLVRLDGNEVREIEADA